MFFESFTPVKHSLTKDKSLIHAADYVINGANYIIIGVDYVISAVN
ncbi:MAG: hypothetical protein IJ417_08575 [Bacteroidaceae bacterium]|nr:hypothetical protein [Bacteroidaceae bacterium]